MTDEKYWRPGESDEFAEERAAKTAVKLVIPLIFCIFPGIMVVLGGPAVLKIWKAIFPLLGSGG